MEFPIDIVRMLFRLLKPRDGWRYGATCRRYYELFIESIARGDDSGFALTHYCKRGMTFAALRLLSYGARDATGAARAAILHGDSKMIQLLRQHGWTFLTQWQWEHVIKHGNVKAMRLMWVDDPPLTYGRLIGLAICYNRYKMLNFFLGKMGAQTRRYMYGEKCVECSVTSNSVHGDCTIRASESGRCLTCTNYYCHFNLRCSRCKTPGGARCNDKYSYILAGGAAYHIDFWTDTAIICRRPKMLARILSCAVLREYDMRTDYKNAMSANSFECAKVIAAMAASAGIEIGTNMVSEQGIAK